MWASLEGTIIIEDRTEISLSHRRTAGDLVYAHVIDQFYYRNFCNLIDVSMNWKDVLIQNISICVQCKKKKRITAYKFMM